MFRRAFCAEILAVKGQKQVQGGLTKTNCFVVCIS